MNTPILSANFFYCPQTNQYIYFGDTIAQVKQICGEPISEESKKITLMEEREVVQYIYHFQPNTKIRIYKKESLVIDFVDEKIVNIQVEGVPVSETNYCSTARLIKIGDLRRWAFYVCRDPSVIQTVTQSVPKERVTQTILTYRESAYLPLVKLYFYDDKLVEIE